MVGGDRRERKSPVRTCDSFPYYLFILNLFAQGKSQETWYHNRKRNTVLVHILRPSSGRAVLGNGEDWWREGNGGVVVDGI